MFSAASRLIWGANDEVEEPPAHLLDCLDFVESSSEDEKDFSDDDNEENTLNVCDSQNQHHQDAVSDNSDIMGVLSKSLSKSPPPPESPDTQKLFHRYARMYLKLIFQSSTSESSDVQTTPTDNEF